MAKKGFKLYMEERDSDASISGNETFNLLDNAVGKVTLLDFMVKFSGSRTLFVDDNFSTLSSPFFATIEEAITEANTLSPTTNNPVTIQAYLDDNGAPVGLGEEDFYTLRDSGIIFESIYDPINKLIKGGEIVESDFLYEYKETEMNIEVTL
jgi:hypothetical protein